MKAIKKALARSTVAQALVALTLSIMVSCQPATASTFGEPISGPQGDVEIIVGVATKHVFGFDPENNAMNNEDNQLFAFRYQNVIAGTYVNTLHRRSYFAGGMWRWHDPYNIISVGVVAGVITGYCLEALTGSTPELFDGSKCNAQPLPFVAPVLTATIVQGVNINAKLLYNAVNVSFSLDF